MKTTSATRNKMEKYPAYAATEDIADLVDDFEEAIKLLGEAKDEVAELRNQLDADHGHSTAGFVGRMKESASDLIARISAFLEGSKGE